jgi:ssDNA-binding replication factor A large subunit
MQLPEGPSEAVLDKVVGRYHVVSQRASKASQAGNFGFDVPIEVDHRGSLRLASGGQATDSNVNESTDGL